MMENSKLTQWYDLQRAKDEFELKVSKERLIKEIKKLKKDEIIKKEKALTIWERLKRVMGF